MVLNFLGWTLMLLKKVERIIKGSNLILEKQYFLTFKTVFLLVSIIDNYLNLEKILKLLVNLLGYYIYFK